MKVFYSDLFTFPLPEGHRFPIRKYALLRDQLVQRSGSAPVDLLIPPPATDKEICLAHAEAYLSKVKSGQLTDREIRRIGFPWSPELVERSRRSVGGTIKACRAALVDGVGVNLAGGTHHAGRDHGEGFCIFNDTAIAARVLIEEGGINQIAILDADVHQGNGTASILAGDQQVFTFSIHAAKNFPFRKAQSDLDISLPDGAADTEFLAAFADGVRQSLAKAQPDLVIYLAGADPYKGDRLGRLKVTKEGLVARDRILFERCFEDRIPIATVMGGGYAVPIEDTVDIHLKTVLIAVEMFHRWKQYDF